MTNRHQQALLASLAPMTPAVSHEQGEDAKLGAWMNERNIDPRELEVYDWMTAMRAGADKAAHSVSDFKRDNHPDLVVGGFNTKTGKRVPGATLAKSVQELIDKGWEPATAKQLWASVTK